LWRCGDSLFFEVPHVASYAPTHFSKNLETISCLGAPFSWLEKPRNRIEQYLDCMVDVGVPPIHFFQAKHRIQFRSRPMLEKGGTRKWVPLFPSNNQEIPYPEIHDEHNGKSEVVHRISQKLFPQGHDTKQCSP